MLQFNAGLNSVQFTLVKDHYMVCMKRECALVNTHVVTYRLKYISVPSTKRKIPANNKKLKKHFPESCQKPSLRMIYKTPSQDKNNI